jgi:hypothetical protein
LYFPPGKCKFLLSNFALFGRELQILSHKVDTFWLYDVLSQAFGSIIWQGNWYQLSNWKPITAAFVFEWEACFLQ